MQKNFYFSKNRISPGVCDPRGRTGISLDKIRELRALADESGLATIIEVDGGISAANAREVFEAGAEVLVAGSAVFKAADPEAEIRRILEA